MATLPIQSFGALPWQLYSSDTSDLIAAFKVDLVNYSAWSFTPQGVPQNAQVQGARKADGVVVDNLSGAADVTVSVGVIANTVPRFQKAVIPLASGVLPVVISGVGVTPNVYFYAGTFHGQTDNVSFYQSQVAASMATITSGTIDAYLQTLRWKYTYALANGANLDNIADSGFYDVYNPVNAGTSLPTGYYYLECVVYSGSGLYQYQRAKSIVAAQITKYERRNVTGTWTPWVSVSGGGAGAAGVLRYVSSSQIAFQPLNGNSFSIAGVPYTIPAAGVPLANTGLTAATLYLIYAYGNAGALALEASTTAHVTDATTGDEVKSGDPTRKLVGQVYMDAGTPGLFADAPAKRYVASWFNRSWKSLVQPGSGSPVSFAGGPTELSSQLRAYFLTWGDSAVDVIAEGGMYANTAGFSATLSMGIDGANQSNTNVFCVSITASYYYPAHTRFMGALSEGLHYASPFGTANASNPATFNVITRGQVFI